MKIIKIVLILISIAVIIVAGFYGLKYYQHHQPIPADAVNIEYPLKNGKFLVTQSGRHGKIHTTSLEKYALDIAKYPTLKSLFQFHQTSLDSDPSFGTPVYSPCDGIIKRTKQTFPDVLIGINGDSNEANLVVISCDGFDLMLVHLKKNSVLVNEGDAVLTGQQVGQIGNSGNSSGPHLHIHAYKTDLQTQERIPLPITFDGKYFYRGDSFTN